MKWQFSNDAPIYTQLIEQIKVGIVAGAFPPGERLPSVRDLATEAGVNPNTMQRALAELERDGLVFSQRTAGRFVTEDKTMIEKAKRGLAERHIKTFLAAMLRLGSRPDDFFCILTRGHAWDRACLEQILRGRYAYVGMIGSRGKVAATRKALEEAGVSRERLDSVHAPIGLDLGGQTPAEIAVEIAAQLIQVRAGLGPALTPPAADHGVLCTITAKSGSAPRGPGAWMLVYPDGHTIGTVGGGRVEYQVGQDALALWESGGETGEKSYDLASGGDLGMICGGHITVAFRRQ